VLSLRALAIKLKNKEYFDKSDKIITTPFTFTATGDAILRSGATPVFVDIDPNTYNIDPRAIRDCLKRSSKAVGIIPVHLYGMACQMDEIKKIADEYDLFVVEDVAQAFGAEWKGKKVGSMGTTGCFSFFPSKNLGGFGDGGMVSTNDDRINELMRMLLKHGGKDKYNVDHIGYNARIDTLQAAIVIKKMKYIDEFNEKRRAIAAIYDEGLKGINGLIIPLTDDGHVYHQYTVQVDASKRNAVQQYLKSNGISTMVYYPFPLHKMKVFEGRCEFNGMLTHTEQACERVFSLPVEPLLERADMQAIIDTLRKAC
jgi:dTDP-4-amino-4,6-dideoxygalactose transaminase